MRENFDFVTMDTYSADMADLTSMAAAAINSTKSEVKSLQRLVWLLVQANGGSVKIQRHVLCAYSAETALLTIEYMAHDMSTVVSTR